MDPLKKTEIFLDQIAEAGAYSSELLRQGIRLHIDIDDDHISFFRQHPLVLRDIGGMGFIVFELQSIHCGCDEDLKTFREYDIELWLDNVDLHTPRLSETALALFTGIKTDKFFFWHQLKREDKRRYFRQILRESRLWGKQVIVQGVKEGVHLDFLQNKTIDGMQGGSLGGSQKYHSSVKFIVRVSGALRHDS